jgi:hypothetical protein
MPLSTNGPSFDPSQAEERLDPGRARAAGRHATAQHRAPGGGNYDRLSLPTLKKVARALGAEIEIKLSA